MKWIELDYVVGKTGMISDGDWVISSDMDANGKVRLLQLADIGLGIFLDKTSKFINEAKLKELNGTLVKNGDILISRMAEPVGRSCIVENLEGLAITAVDVTILRVDSDLADVRYLNRFFNHALFLRKANQLARGTTRKRITRKNLQKIKIPLPPLPEQKRIAQLLDTADALRQRDKALLEGYDELLESVFLEMFGNVMTNERRWELKNLDFFGKIVTGNTPSTKNDSYYGDYIEWIKSDNINTPHRYLTKADKYLSQEGSEVGRVVPRNSLLVICIAGSLSSLGKVAIADRNVAFNQQINAIIPNTKIVNVDFLYVQFLMSQIKVQDASTKSMKGMISKSKFSKIEFIYPPISLQNKFAQIVQNIEAQKEKVRKQLEESEDLFGALMQEVFG